MNRNEQIRFVNDLTGSMARTIKNHIRTGRIPREWDGLELRQLIAEHAQRNAYVDMGKARKREYNNTVIVNNL